jgi:hypothetical protein
MNDVLAAIGSLGEELRKANERIERQHEAIRQLRAALTYMDDYLGDDKPMSNFSKRVKAALAATENSNEY